MHYNEKEEGSFLTDPVVIVSTLQHYCLICDLLLQTREQVAGTSISCTCTVAGINLSNKKDSHICQIHIGTS